MDTLIRPPVLVILRARKQSIVRTKETETVTAIDQLESDILKPTPLSVYRKEYSITIPRKTISDCAYLEKLLEIETQEKIKNSSHSNLEYPQIILEFPTLKLLDSFLLALLCLADPNNHQAQNVLITNSNKFQIYSASCLLSIEALQLRCESFITENLSFHELHRSAHAAEKFNRTNFREDIFRWICYKYKTISDGQLEQASQDTYLTFTEKEIILGKRTLACAQYASVIRNDIILKRKYFAPLERNDGSPQRCYVVRKSGAGSTGLETHFLVRDEESDELLLSACHVPGSNDFIFSTTYPEKYSKTNRDYLAFLSCNFIGTTFTIYDYGIEPTQPAAKSFPELIRGEHGVIRYDRNVLGHVPNAMTILIPFHQQNSAQPRQSNESLVKRLDKGNLDGMVKLRTLKPLWNDGLESWTLDFEGRVKMASKRNFEVHFPDEFRSESDRANAKDRDWLMLFGRVTKDRYSLDFKPPMSLIQTFSIALTTFADKLVVT